MVNVNNETIQLYETTFRCLYASTSARNGGGGSGLGAWTNIRANTEGWG